MELTFEKALANIQKNYLQNKTDWPVMPTGFDKLNQHIGLPIHPNTKKPTHIYDYQLDYFDAVMQYHKVLLNKSRKIGASETGLRIFLYNIFTGKYADRNILIVAGNKQQIADTFIQRIYNIVRDGVYDIEDNKWSFKEIVVDRRHDHIEWTNGCHIWSMPANDSVRGFENVAGILMSEVSFIDLLDDSKVYNAVKPNLANIDDADFILESTPNGRRGFFYDLAVDAKVGKNEYKYLEQPYTVSLNKLISQQFIDTERANPKIDFEQEYECKFTTSLTAAFKEETIKYGEESLEFNEY